ncbi:MAG: DUF177 domain-containing protein [Chloroflexota bacterium]|nr:DUF177 domain-containing protein [Chloroflexota bacterium]
MNINVSQQLKEAVGSTRRYSINEVQETGFPICGEVRLLRTDRSIIAACKLKTTVALICSRCLEQYDLPLALDFEEEYFLTKEPGTGVPLDNPIEPCVFTIDENHILDLSEAVRQYTLLALPMKPVCREDCAGLCSQCGCNRNYETCECSSFRPDSVWSPLLELLSGEKQLSDKERG